MPTSAVGKSPTVNFFSRSRDKVRGVRCKWRVEDVARRDSFVDAAETEAPAAEGMLLHFEILSRLKDKMAVIDGILTS